MRIGLAVAAAAAVMTACASASPPPLTPPSTSSTSTTAAREPSTTLGGSESTTTMAATTTVAATTSSVATTTPETTLDDGPLSGKTVVIDPGHNGRNAEHRDEIDRLVDVGNGTKACNTTGTQTNDGYPEPDFTWTAALATRRVLEDLGARVVFTRQDNDGWGPCVDERAAIGNEAGADAVISIHADGGPDTGRGFHVIHPAVVEGLTDDIAEPSRALAGDLLEAMRSTDMPVADYVGSGGLSERDDLGGLNLSDVPAVFLEAGNMRNAEDVRLLTDDDFIEEIAAAIGRALVAFLG